MDSTPVFSWARTPSATAHDLVVMSFGQAPQDEDLVIDLRLPGGASMWTTPEELALEPGQYAWAVRSRLRVAGAEQPERWTEWSEPRLFIVPGKPSAAEVRRALEVLLSTSAADPAFVPQVRSDLELVETATDGATAPGGTEGAPSALLMGPAALTGEGSASGLASGAAGITASADGAGVVATNLGKGPDLVVSGDPNDANDRSSIVSSAIGDVLFESTSGSTEVEVGGSWLWTLGTSPSDPLMIMQRTALLARGDFHGDGSGVANLTGTSLDCSNCVNGSEIAANALTGADIANASLSGADVATGALTTAHVSGANPLTGTDVLDNSLTANSLASGSISTSRIVDNAVGSSEIATDGVQTADIANGAVHSSEIHDIWRVKVECGASCADSLLLNICALVSGSRPIGVSCSKPSSMSSFTACTGDNTCQSLLLQGAVPLSSYCEPVSGADAMVFCLDD